MQTRCYNKRNPRFEDWGGRGIAVCDRWRFGEAGKHPFECFLADMGKKPDPDLSLDRINPNGNYEPGNCRWATAMMQQFNRRNSAQPKTNR